MPLSLHMSFNAKSTIWGCQKVQEMEVSGGENSGLSGGEEEEEEGGKKTKERFE